MKVAVMQPYFFPYIGYFSLMDVADHFVFFDTPQYQRKSWMLRNRIYDHTPQGWQYFRLNIEKAPQQTSLADIRLKEQAGWGKIFKQIQMYKKKAPYYEEVRELLELISSGKFEKLAEFNCHSLEYIAEYLGIDCQFSTFSELGVEVPEECPAGEWALYTCLKLGAEEYINPEGGTDLFDREKYDANNIRLSFLKHNLPVYPQATEVFTQGLSIIDLLMFNSKEQLMSILRDYTLFDAK